MALWCEKRPPIEQSFLSLLILSFLDYSIAYEIQRNNHDHQKAACVAVSKLVWGFRSWGQAGSEQVPVPWSSWFKELNSKPIVEPALTRTMQSPCEPSLPFHPVVPFKDATNYSLAGVWDHTLTWPIQCQGKFRGKLYSACIWIYLPVQWFQQQNMALFPWTLANSEQSERASNLKIYYSKVRY